MAFEITLFFDFVVGRLFKLHVCGFQNREKPLGQKSASFKHLLHLFSLKQFSF